MKYEKPEKNFGRQNLLLILDSNEYINYLSKKNLLLDEITRNDKLTIHINETITKEVLNNINEQLKKRFYDFLFTKFAFMRFDILKNIFVDNKGAIAKDFSIAKLYKKYRFRSRFRINSKC